MAMREKLLIVMVSILVASNKKGNILQNRALPRFLFLNKLVIIKKWNVSSFFIYLFFFWD